jgi:retron-type reverse transcriptase
MFFKKKKDPLKAYIINDLNTGLKRMIKDGLIDINSPLAGMHIINYINHMKKSYAETRPLFQIKYSLDSLEVSKRVLEAVNEFKNEWIES